MSDQQSTILKALREQGMTPDEVARQVSSMLHSDTFGDRKWALDFVRKASEADEGRRKPARESPMDLTEARARLKAAITRLIDIGLLRPEARNLLVDFINAPECEITEEESPDAGQSFIPG